MLKTFRILAFARILLILPGLGSFALNAADSRAEFIQDTIKITDFGAKPNSRANVVSAVQAALNACKGKPNPVLVFPPMGAMIWPHMQQGKSIMNRIQQDNNPKTLGVFIEKFTTLTIDGKGSTFIYHGRMQPFTKDNSFNVVIKNIDIDWDIPLTAQVEVKAVTDNYIDIQIDEKQFPYEIENGKLVFVGEGWKSGIRAFMDYMHDTQIIAPQTGDDPALGYHRNIQITHNEFHPYDYPIVFAQSVSGLKFENNTLTRSYDYKPFHSRKVTFTLIGSRNVTIRNNQVGSDILGKNVKLMFMKKSDVKLQKEFMLDNRPD